MDNRNATAFKTKYDKLKGKFTHRKPIIGTGVGTFFSPVILENMLHPDLDFILMDAEHGFFDTQNVIPMLHTCRMLGVPGFMRVQDCQYHLIAKAIDMGADGVMIPRVETLEQVQTVIDAVRFSPIGRKGAGGYGQIRPGESFDKFQENRFILLQIESPAGIKTLPSILDAYNNQISAIIVGPADMSVMLGRPFDTKHPEVTQAVQQVFDTCNQYQKSCGIFCADADDAALYQAMGANVLWTASDLHFYLRGFKETMQELKKLI